MSVVFVGLGSNLGDRAGHLRRALRALDDLPGVTRQGCSSFRRTAPEGGPPQPDFVNAVVRCEASLPPAQLLHALLRIEAWQGRRRLITNGPRTLDLDLLLYGTHRSRSTELELPHPRLRQRRFVLEPLAQLAPRLPLIDGRTVEQCLAALC